MEQDAGKFEFGIPPEGPGDAYSAGVAGIPTIKKRQFGRVVVLLGANGAGKSRLLASLARHSPNEELDRPVVYVEGGRTLVIGPRGAGFVPEGGSQNDRISKRLTRIFNTIERERVLSVEEHKEALYQWDVSGNGDEKPQLKPAAFDRVSEVFTSLFPRLSLHAELTKLTEGQQPAYRWYCKSGAHEYDTNRMSDGEKQVLCLLCDIGELSPAKSLIIVDEPELNLHPSLAMNLWNAIERLRSESVFVYATHSLSFAMRQSVTDVVVLGDARKEPIHLTTPFNWANEELGPFLGAIPAVVTCGRLVAVEGDDSSFDHDFYQWVIGAGSAIASLGSSDFVRNAVMHHGIWERCGNAKIFGVVDRDFKPEAALDYLRKSGCCVLDYHEAESYLCHPLILAKASEHSGTNIAESEARTALIARCECNLLKVALNRAVQASEIRLSLGPKRNQMTVASLEEGVKLINQLAEQESPRADAFKETCEQLFREEYARCKKALDEKNVDEILAIFPGKEMTKQMAKLAGFESPTKLLNALRKFHSPNEFPPLVEIRKAAGDKFGQPL